LADASRRLRRDGGAEMKAHAAGSTHALAAPRPLMAGRGIANWGGRGMRARLRRPPRTILFAVTALHRALYRTSGGRIGGRIGAGRVLLLTTIGRRSGKRRTVPLAYLPDRGRLVVIAAFGGADVHPAWFLNLMACADVEVELAGQPIRRMRAAPVAPDKHASLWHKVTALYPRCSAYQRRTARPIPLVILEPS
jgi:F420H(2)-dependent quinone reductase